MARQKGSRSHLPARVVTLHLEDNEWASIRIAAIKQNKTIGLWVADTLSKEAIGFLNSKEGVTETPALV